MQRKGAEGDIDRLGGVLLEVPERGELELRALGAREQRQQEGGGVSECSDVHKGVPAGSVHTYLVIRTPAGGRVQQTRVAARTRTPESRVRRPGSATSRSGCDPHSSPDTAPRPPPTSGAPPAPCSRACRARVWRPPGRSTTLSFRRPCR